MNRFTKQFGRLFKRTANSPQPQAPEPAELVARIGYQKLEQRQVLSATFSFGAGLLTLDGFDVGQDLTFSQDTVDIGASMGVDAFIFEIDGMAGWTDLGGDPGIELESPTRLEVTASLLTNGIVIDGGNNINVVQKGAFAVSEIGFSNLTFENQSLDLNIDGNVRLSGISITDTDSMDMIDPDFIVQATGTITVDGLISNQGSDPNSFISLSATGIGSDIIVDGASIQTNAGDISLLAADDISLLNNSLVDAGFSGSVDLTANTDDADMEIGGIMISDGSSISSATGSIDLLATGTEGGDATIGNISTTGAITVDVTGDIIDGTLLEVANIVGSRTDLTGATIGLADDLQLDVDDLSFNADGVVQLVDLAGGVSIDAVSSAQDGSLTTHSPLTISADVNLAGSFSFVASGSALFGDNITINNNAIVDLIAATNETVEFIAGDDIIFDTGRVTTGGGGVHEVILTADAELALDANRGSISNSPGMASSVESNILTVSAADGVGDLSNGLRTSVDSISIINSLGNGVFICEENGIRLTSIVNVGRDISIAAGGFIQIDGAIDAGMGSVRLIAEGDVLQSATSSISADELGVRQQGTVFSAGDDVDANTRFDIQLDAGNDVNVLGAFNAFDGGTLVFVDSDNLTIDEIGELEICAGVTFQTTAGVVSTHTGPGVQGPGDIEDGDILINAGGFLQINQQVNAGTADVRLTAVGDVLQSVTGNITADELGVRQIGTNFTDVDDLDANMRFDIILDAANEAGFTSAFNAFDRGVLAFDNQVVLTIDAVSAQLIGFAAFKATSGASTTFTGPVAIGPGDVDDGDIILRADSGMQINQPIIAGNGTADVRLTSNGPIDQIVSGVILANEFGVRQELTGNIHLCADNDVDIFAAFNNNGNIEFQDFDGFLIGDVSAQAIGNVAFSATSGVVGADIFLTSAGNLEINNVLDAGAFDVLLIANGDITQTPGSVIIANQLGIRQEALVYDALEDIDANGRFDILLGDQNDVNLIAAFNAFDSGVFVFNDVDDLAVGRVATQMYCNDTFLETIGVATTFAGPPGLGAGDVDSGDILINVDGFLQIDEIISAATGIADVRLIANGDVHQLVTSAIIANELGVRQESNTLVAANDPDANSRYDILLDGVNDVDVMAGLNVFDGGVMTFHDIDGLTLGEVSAQTVVGISFSATAGLTTTYSGADGTGAGDVVDGDILVHVDGFLEVNQSVIAGGGASDVRFHASGDVSQDAILGVISANELGVSQSGIVLDAGNDLDSNTVYDVHLCAPNDVDVLGAENAFVAGDVQFDNVRGYTVGEVSGQTINAISFTGVDGVATSDGDVFLNSPGFLDISAPITAGTGLIRLIANGDIHQAAATGIVSSQLGIRQEGLAINATDDLDANTRYDIILSGNNNVDVVAAFNAYDGGVIALNDIDGITVGEVAALVVGTKSFALTTGIQTTFTGAAGSGPSDIVDGDIIVNTGGYLEINRLINAGGGAADVRLTANGDVVQVLTGTISANEFGVRQEGVVLVVSNDLDNNGFYDIDLCHANVVDVMAGGNQFSGGDLQLNNTQRLIIGEISAQTIDGVMFTTTAGIRTINGDQFVASAGSLQIQQAIDTGTGTVRLVIGGDIHQSVNGTITAGALGVRQEELVYSVTEDLDANGRLDIILDGGNDVGVLAADNVFDTGVVVFNDNDDLTIGEVAGLNAGDKSFATTAGISTVFTGLAAQGAGDVDSGDVLINADGFLLIDRQISASGGVADVRLTADGDLHQTATGLIFADELGARQESNLFSPAQDVDGNNVYDIILCFENRVSFFAGENQFTGGGLFFNSEVPFTVDQVTNQTIGNVAFVTTTGVSTDGGDYFQSSVGAINITSTIDVGAGTVYLIANGDVAQSAGNVIIAAGLAIRQEATVYVVTEDLDANLGYDIILTDNNQVDTFSALNAYENGQIALNNAGGDLMIIETPERLFCGITFGQITGIDSQGDILVQSSGALSIEAAINADDGADDVRLIAGSDITQTAAGIVISGELGVRQAGLTGDIRLCFNNQVSTFTAFNPVGDINFSNVQAMVIGDVASQTIGNITFTATAGIGATGNSVIVNADGALQINNSIVANEVRLIADGNISQSGTGTITSNILGVRQESAASGSIILDDGNDVNILAALNTFEDGVIAFNDIDDLTIGSVAQALFCDKSFADTVGIDGQGDILIQAGGFLAIEQSINADSGLDDVRLISNGNMTQTTAGIIIANELGVRQESGLGEVLLCFDNQVNSFAGFNPVGDVDFSNIQALMVDEVTIQTVGNINFTTTTGITATGSSAIVNADASLQINNSIVANEVRLIADGNISQSGTGTITSNILGVRQESAASGSIILDDGNDVNILAALNTFEDGVIAFNDIDDLTIGSVAQALFCDKSFADTVGIDGQGDILIQAGGFLAIEQSINADSGLDDVRLISNGNMTQTTAGIIIANELGVRQESGLGEVLLCFDNQVNSFAGFNPVGDVDFSNIQALMVDEVTIQTVGNINFTTTTGITATGSSAIVNADASLQINNSIVANEVRLIADGNISQSGTGTITSNILGVRQESTLSDLTILIDGANDVNFLAGYNASERGAFVFRDIDDLTVGSVSGLIFCDKTFFETVGITTTFAGPGGLGAADATDGDILLDANGFLSIDRTILAGVSSAIPGNRGNADVRLSADGTVSQSITGTIIADELGVRQESNVGVHNIILDDANDVQVLSAVNESDGGVFAFNDTDESPSNNIGLTIGGVSGQSMGTITFSTTNGIATTYSGPPVAGLDVNSGDILVNSDGYLKIHEQLDAAGGNADIRVVANGDIVQSPTGEITANELGVSQVSSIFNATNDLNGNTRHDISLGEMNNDVDHLAMANHYVNGDLWFRDIDSLTIDQVIGQAIGSVVSLTISGITSDDGTTLSLADGTGNIRLEANGTLNDGDGIPIITGGAGSFRGDLDIELADQITDRLLIGQNVFFESPDVEVGQDGVAAGNANVLFGNLTIDDRDPTGETGDADITEDDSTTLTGNSSINRLALTSAGDINNDVGAHIRVNQVQFNATNGAVFIGNRSNDMFGRFDAGGNPLELEVGVVALNVSIAADSSVEINGNIPLNPDLNRSHSVEPTPFAVGTEVVDTLFVTSFATDLSGDQVGHIEQTVGDLNATRLGLAAGRHVHLQSISSSNVAVSIDAGDSDAAANPQQTMLDQLAAISGSEVRSTLAQSVSVVHQGDLVVTTVVNPDVIDMADEVIPRSFVTGVSTTATEDGSILLAAMESISIKANVSANSSGSLPQVTAYVQNAVANDSAAISFAGGSILVEGSQGTETNRGLVNHTQTRAFFGTDSDSDGDIDQFLVDTTKIIRLDSGTGTAEQLIRALYGNAGEEGYRVSFVWDSQRRFDAGFASSQEVPNLYTINGTTDFERFDVEIFNQDAPPNTVILVDGNAATVQTDLIEQIAHDAAYNFNTLFVKVNPYTENAIIVRLDDLRVFTTAEVRNDQDINLFVGQLNNADPTLNADNSLNSVSETLESVLETASVRHPSLPMVFETNVIPFEPPIVELVQQTPFLPTFDKPEIRRPDIPGTLSWIAVRIGDVDDDDDEPGKYIIEVDGELILKNPQAEYLPLDDDEQPTEIRNADKNQIEKIIEQIEKDENAEAGLWYKIFIDYEEGTGKKDELLFYYFKTGRQQNDELGPDSDFEKNSDERNGQDPPETDDNSNLKQDNPEDNSGAFVQPTAERPVFGKTTGTGEPGPDQASAGGAKLGLSSGTVLLATLASRKQRALRTAVIDQLVNPDVEVSFSRFERLKRRVTSMLGNQAG